MSSRNDLWSVLLGFENEERIFPGVHHDTNFCLLTLTTDGRGPEFCGCIYYARQGSGRFPSGSPSRLFLEGVRNDHEGTQMKVLAFPFRGYTRGAAIRPNKHHPTGHDCIAFSYPPENICQSQIQIARQGSGSESRSLQE